MTDLLKQSGYIHIGSIQLPVMLCAFVAIIFVTTFWYMLAKKEGFFSALLWALAYASTFSLLGLFTYIDAKQQEQERIAKRKNRSDGKLTDEF